MTQLKIVFSVYPATGAVQCSTLGRGQIHLLPPSQIQKLADRSDVISVIAKCSKIQISDPAGGAYSAPQSLYLMGRGSLPHCQEPHLRSRPFGPRFYGSQGLTHYRVGNPTNDRFQM